MNWLIRKYIADKSCVLRDRKIDYLAGFLQPQSMILDVGVWSQMPEPNPSENWLEKKYSSQVQIVAVGLHDMREFKRIYPNVLCVQADGCALPFKNNAVVAAFSNAVLEHVPASGQLRFIDEIARIVQHRAVLAVPDRLSPIEIHSRIFFIHWLPWWRYLFRLLGQVYWASEDYLTCIFTHGMLRALLARCSVLGQWKILRHRLFFLPVSLIAIFDKEY